MSVPFKLLYKRNVYTSDLAVQFVIITSEGNLKKIGNVLLKLSWPTGMVDFEKIVNTEIEIYRIEIFFLISKSVFTESVFEICNFDFDFKSIISKFYKSI